jgi:hypothetical protein
MHPTWGPLLFSRGRHSPDRDPPKNRRPTRPLSPYLGPDWKAVSSHWLAGCVGRRSGPRRGAVSAGRAMMRGVSRRSAQDGTDDYDLRAAGRCAEL